MFSPKDAAPRSGRVVPVVGALVGLAIGLIAWLWSSETDAPPVSAVGRGSAAGLINALSRDTGATANMESPTTVSPKAQELSRFVGDLCRLGKFDDALDRVNQSSLDEGQKSIVRWDLIEELLPEPWVQLESKDRIVLADVDVAQWKEWEDAGVRAPRITQLLKSSEGVQQLGNRWAAFKEVTDKIEDKAVRCRALRKGVYWAFLIQGLQHFDSKPNVQPAETPAANEQPDQSRASGDTPTGVSSVSFQEITGGQSLSLQLTELVEELDSTSPKDLRRTAVSGSVNLLRTSLLTVLGALATLVWNAVSSQLSRVVQRKVEATLGTDSDEKSAEA